MISGGYSLPALPYKDTSLFDTHQIKILKSLLNSNYPYMTYLFEEFTFLDFFMSYINYFNMININLTF